MGLEIEPPNVCPECGELEGESNYDGPDDAIVTRYRCQSCQALQIAEYKKSQ